MRDSAAAGAISNTLNAGYPSHSYPARYGNRSGSG